MVKEAARDCSHCGHYGNNSRTCNGGKSFRLFGVNIENSRKGSMSMENLQSVVDVHVDAWSPSDGKRDKVVRKARKGIAWTEKEHTDFLAGLNMLGKGNWKGIAMQFVKTRSPSQVASHAQKFFLRLASPDNKKRRASLFDMQYQQSASVSGGAFYTKSTNKDSLELKIGPPQSPQGRDISSSQESNLWSC
ncbi:hypothetical protein QYF36_025884 [Acer negundo]|nr:hypothetical protein QYF36_025884 [Acer negundo]